MESNSPPPIAIQVALQDELKLVKRLLTPPIQTVQDQQFTYFEGTLQGRKVVLIQSGMGNQSASEAASYLINKTQTKYLIVVGFAGSLHPELECGDLLIASSIHPESFKETIDLEEAPIEIASQSGKATLSDSAFHIGGLASLDSPLTTREAKREAHRASGALGVDMESFGAYEACQSVDCSLLCTRSILDDAHTELPPQVIGLTDKWGRVKITTLLARLLRNPALISTLLSLAKAKARAESTLGTFLNHLILNLPEELEE